MNVSEASIPLWRQLQATAGMLQSIRGGVSGTAALERVAPQLRPGVQALIFHVLRSLGRAQALRQQLAPRRAPPPADALLCTALALAWQEQDAPYEVFTLVNQAVEAAKRSPDTRQQASFINACLRRLEIIELREATDDWQMVRTRHLYREETPRLKGIPFLVHQHLPALGGLRLAGSARDLGTIDLTKA